MEIKPEINQQLLENQGVVLLADQLQTLNDMGFTKTKQNTRLLLQTGGNFEIVLNFLISRKQIKEACSAERTSLKRLKKIAKQERNVNHGRKERKEKGWKNKQDKESFKKEKELKKAAKRARNGKSSDVVPFPTSGNLPTVYLDGNNMLFVCSSLRSLVLKRQIRKAEQILVSLARKFAIMLNLAKCVVIFDDTDKHEESESFVVCSARPSRSTSDDALVEWATSSQRALSPAGIFVTSDRELCVRLSEVGAVLVRPKEWFNYALGILTGQRVDDLDACMTAWLDAEGLTKP